LDKDCTELHWVVVAEAAVGVEAGVVAAEGDEAPPLPLPLVTPPLFNPPSPPPALAPPTPPHWPLSRSRASASAPPSLPLPLLPTPSSFKPPSPPPAQAPQAPPLGPLSGESNWTYPHLASSASFGALGALPLLWGCTCFLTVILVAQIIGLRRQQRRAYATFPKSDAHDAPPEMDDSHFRVRI